jgi:hypothetical protein
MINLFRKNGINTALYLILLFEKQMKNFLPAFLALILISSCKKKEEVICFANTGGNHTLTLKTFKEGIPYFSTSSSPVKAFLAFEQYEVSGFSDSSFDLVKFAGDNDDFVRFNNLKCGIYFCKLRVIDSATGKTYAGSRIVTLNAETLSAEAAIDMTLVP